MRNPKIAAVVVLAAGLVAMQAGASSLVRLDYVGGSTAAGGTGGTAIAANPGDLLSFDVSVEVDAIGLCLIHFDMEWVDDANSALVSATWATGSVFTSFAPFTSAVLNMPTAPTVSGGTGLISNIGWTPSSPTGPFSVSTNVFLGTVVFHVKADLPQVVQTGFFDANFAVALDASLALITPDFTSFTTNPVMASRVPSLGAPGMALLWALLALVGWWALRGQQQRRCL